VDSRSRRYRLLARPAVPPVAGIRLLAVYKPADGVDVSIDVPGKPHSGRVNRTSRLLIVIAVLGLGVIAPTLSNAAEVACSQRVLTDWSDNGRIDRIYSLPCYEEAIAALPTDIRDYTNAQDVIDRAMANAVRASAVVPTADAEASDAQGGDPIDASAAVPVPLPLVVLFGLALALLAAGGVARVGRRAILGRKEPPR
jgi:hypothetical protein